MNLLSTSKHNKKTMRKRRSSISRRFFFFVLDMIQWSDDCYGSLSNHIDYSSRFESDIEYVHVVCATSFLKTILLASDSVALIRNIQTVSDTSNNNQTKSDEFFTWILYFNHRMLVCLLFNKWRWARHIMEKEI